MSAVTVNWGEFYLRQRVFLIVSRQALIESRFTSVVCAPLYSQHDGLSTQVSVGPEDGLKKDCSIHCDELVSLPKSLLTHYVGSLERTKLKELDSALAVAVGLEVTAFPSWIGPT